MDPLTAGPRKLMLRAIQERLERLYDLDVDASVEDFLCDAELARATSHDGVERGEVLVVVEDPEDLSIGLYVDPEAVELLRAGADWSQGPRAFRAFCLATEGVSHFVYLMFRAVRSHVVSQLELEIQAEIDKYATALLAPGRAGSLLVRSRELRGRLYDGARFVDGDDTEAGRRYRTASRAAARYARHLESRYVGRGDLGGLSRALRRFYRVGGCNKLTATERQYG